MEGQTQISDDESELIDIFCQYFLGGMVLCTYIIGVYLHGKLIQASKKDKEMTWMMDICNSIFLLILYAYIIIMKTLTYAIDNVQTYTGSWFCYTSKALSLIGHVSCAGHTFIIAIMKYVMIVLHEKIRFVGKEKMQRIFLTIYIIYPLYMFGVFNIINPDFLFVYDGISHANRCLGKSEIFSGNNTNKTAIKLHDICKLTEPFDPGSFQYIVHLSRSVICWFHVIIMYLNGWNVIEAFIYFFIFKFMWR